MDLVTVDVRIGSLAGTLAGTFVVHVGGLIPGQIVRAEGGGTIFTVQEVVWLGGSGVAPAKQAIVVVAP